jgi:Tol biopolymer transport system component
MNRAVRLLRNGLGLLLLLALAAGAAWVIVQSRPRPPQTAGSPLPTPTPVRSPTPRQPAPASPTPAATRVGQRVPFCTFPGGEPPDKGGPGLDRYEFSEPRVVLTNTKGIAIADWLPDNNRLLITRFDPQSGLERIETLDVRSGEVQLYAERGSHNGKPVWLSAIQGVAYTDAPSLITNLPKTTPQYELRIGRAPRGEPESIVTSEGNDIAMGFSLAVDPSGRHLLYAVDRTGDRLQNWDSVAHTNQATSFDVNAWRRFPPDLSQPAWQYIVIPFWSPNGARLAVFVGPSSLFLVEPGPNRVCEVNLEGRWPKAELSRWSPNARYLALITSDRMPSPLVGRTDVTVLDVLTGEVRTLPLPAERGWAMNIAWGGNGQHLIVLAAASYRQERANQTKLFLADAITGDVRQMLSDHFFGGGAQWGEQLAWSRNGRSLAIECPVIAETGSPVLIEDRICIIATETRP